MLIKPGEKIFVITRRFYEEEIKRHFIGEIIEAEGSLAKLKGYTYIFDKIKNQFIKKPDIRTRILDVSEGVYIVNLIPSDVNISDIQYVTNKNNQLVATDMKDFSLDINEFGVNK